LEFIWHGSGRAIRFPNEAPAFGKARDALTAECGRDAVFIGGGGSVPVTAELRQALGMDVVLASFALDDDRIHSPNEKYEVESLRRGVCSWVRILHALARWAGSGGWTLRTGDALLLTGFWSDIRKYRADTHELIPLGLPSEMDEVLPAADKAPHALAALALVVALMVTGAEPNVQVALIGCLLMGALGCVDMTSAYRSIGRKGLVLIVGMLPFSIALQRTWGVDLVADALIGTVGGSSPRVVLGTLLVITAASRSRRSSSPPHPSRPMATAVAPGKHRETDSRPHRPAHVRRPVRPSPPVCFLGNIVAGR
jgi:hypothetical protein